MSLGLFRQTTRRTSQLVSASSLRGIRALHSTSSLKEHYLDASPELFKNRIAQKDRLILVDFYADWCGPCKTISPILKKLTSELKTKEGNSIDLITVDTDSEESIPLAAMHKIRALPTVIAFKDGKPVDQFVGAIPEESIKDFIAKQ